MKKAIVLGIGNAQLDLIRYLKSQGWWVIGCSYRREGRGLEEIDQFALLNVIDADGIEQLARAERVDLVYSIGSDLAMPAAARVASRLGLPFLVPAETAELLQNKLLLRDFLTRHAISPIRFKGIRSQSELDDWRIFPAMLKPVDNQGQRGVFLANNLEAARGGLEGSLRFSRSRTLIIEEFLEGPEISVNTFVLNGETVFCEVSDRLVVEEFPGGIPRGHIYPAVHCPPATRREAQRLTEQCNRALGIQNGPVYYQMILTVGGPRIVEVTPRLDGCHMWRLLKMSSGVDLLEASVKCLLGEAPPELSVRADRSRYLGFYYCPPGAPFLRAHYPPPAAVEYLEYYYADGERVRPINGYSEKVGYYIIPYVQ
jgi:biotin carboxylase